MVERSRNCHFCERVALYSALDWRGRHVQGCARHKVEVTTAVKTRSVAKDRKSAAFEESKNAREQAEMKRRARRRGTALGSNF
jgi:hypothetical protein